MWIDTDLPKVQEMMVARNQEVIEATLEQLQAVTTKGEAVKLLEAARKKLVHNEIIAACESGSLDYLNHVIQEGVHVGIEVATICRKWRQAGGFEIDYQVSSWDKDRVLTQMHPLYPTLCKIAQERGK